MSGCMVFSGMKLAAPGTGLAGMEPPLSSCASVVYCIMSIQGLATGPIM